MSELIENVGINCDFYMNLQSLPRTERFVAIKAVMDRARECGIQGMGGECGELAVAMKRVLFANNASLVAGLNVAFENHQRLIGHFVVQINDEEWGKANFDERGIPVADEEVESWGMLDPTDPDYMESAANLGFDYSEEVAETACMMEFDDDDDVLINLPGSGLESKITILREAMNVLGYTAGAKAQPQFVGKMAASDVTGKLIDEPVRRKQWFDLVVALQEASETVGGPMEGWVFHGTDGMAGVVIESKGLRSSMGIVSMEKDVWIACDVVHFGTANVAAFFAEDRIESLEDPNIDLIVFGAPLHRLAQYGAFAADGQMVDMPLYSRIRQQEKVVLPLWDASDKDWQACLQILETVVVLGDVPAGALTAFRSVADVRAICEANKALSIRVDSKTGDRCSSLDI